MKKLRIIGIGCGTITLLGALAVAAIWFNQTHRAKQVRSHLIEQLEQYAQEVATSPSNLVVQCSPGSWLARLRFSDGDWAAVAHYSRHTHHANLFGVDDITFVLTSDGILYDANMHYCRDWLFDRDLRYGFGKSENEVVYSDWIDFKNKHFYGLRLRQIPFKETTDRMK